MRLACFLLAWAALLGCGSGNDPTEVRYGETTFVVAVNPARNAGSGTDLPAPGTDRANLTVGVDGQLAQTGQTDANGVVVLRRVDPGQRMLTVMPVEMPASAAQVPVRIDDKDLRDVAVAYTGGGQAAEMISVVYAFGGKVIEVSPDDAIGDVNGALSMGDTIVFFRGGRYVGDLVFAGSNVTLFGEGAAGGAVTLEGNIVVRGSGNRIRGARVTGDLTVESTASVAFSRIDGALYVSGSGVVLVQNKVCGSADISGASNLVALGNAGLDALPSGCL